jgi:hypothetical protein
MRTASITTGGRTPPLFPDVHLMFDEFAKDVLETIDEMAERIRMIGAGRSKRAFEADAGGSQCSLGRRRPVSQRDG